MTSNQCTEHSVTPICHHTAVFWVCSVFWFGVIGIPCTVRMRIDPYTNLKSKLTCNQNYSNHNVLSPQPQILDCYAFFEGPIGA